jgi:hypothetical protein
MAVSMPVEASVEKAHSPKNKLIMHVALFFLKLPTALN